MGVLVSGMGVGYLSKRWKRSSSDGSMGSEGWPLAGFVASQWNPKMHRCMTMSVYMTNEHGIFFKHFFELKGQKGWKKYSKRAGF